MAAHAAPLGVPAPRPRPSSVFLADRLVRGSAELRDVLRAVPLHAVTRGAARVFGSNAGGSAKEYDASEPCERIDVFVSHSWASGRAGKALALALHFDAPLALGGALGAAALCAGAAAASAAGACEAAGEARAYRPPLCLSVALCAFCALLGAAPAAREALERAAAPTGPPALTLATPHATPLARARAALGPWLARLCVQPRLFLDVACIHQADPALKRRGIDGIGGFLTASRTLLLLWSPEYLTRLWCCFELAAFHRSIEYQAAQQLLPSPAHTPTQRHPTQRRGSGAATSAPPPLSRCGSSAAPTGPPTPRTPRTPARERAEAAAAACEHSWAELAAAAAAPPTPRTAAPLPPPQPRPLQPSGARPSARGRGVVLLPLSLCGGAWALGAVALAAAALAHAAPAAARGEGGGAARVAAGLSAAALLGSALACAACGRAYCSERGLLRAQLRSFSIEGAACALPDDRALILGLIDLWYSACPGDAASLGSAVRALDGQLVAVMSALTRAQLGACARRLPYRLTLLPAAVALVACLDAALAAAAARGGSEAAGAWAGAACAGAGAALEALALALSGVPIACRLALGACDALAAPGRTRAAEGARTLGAAAAVLGAAGALAAGARALGGAPGAGGAARLARGGLVGAACACALRWAFGDEWAEAAAAARLAARGRRSLRAQRRRSSAAARGGRGAAGARPAPLSVGGGSADDEPARSPAAPSAPALLDVRAAAAKAVAAGVSGANAPPRRAAASAALRRPRAALGAHAPGGAATVGSGTLGAVAAAVRAAQCERGSMERRTSLSPAALRAVLAHAGASARA